MKDERNIRIDLPGLPPVQGPENEQETSLRIPAVAMPEIQGIEDEKTGRIAHWFGNGAWIPSADPLTIGPANFSAMQNLQFGEGCLEGVPGYTKVNTTALASYPKIRSGGHLRAPYQTKSRILVQAWNAGLTGSQVLQNKTAIGSQGDFEATELHTDAAGAGVGRFAQWPGKQIAYSNGVETKIYGGDEIPAAAFITASAAVTGAKLANPKDYSSAVRNTLTSADQVAIIGGGNDSHVVLMLHGDGLAASDISDSSVAAHGNATKDNGAVITTAIAKFGNGSISFPNYNSAIHYADHADWDPAGSDFVIDMWLYAPATLNIGVNGGFTFSENTPAADTIESSGATWADIGVADGDTIYVSETSTGTANRKKFFTIASGSATHTITLNANDDVSADFDGYDIWLAKMLCGRWQDSSHYWFLALAGNKLILDVNGTVTEVNTSSQYGNGFAYGSFNHVALQYKAGTGIYLYCNGYCRTDAIALTLPDLNAPLVFGAAARAASLSVDAKGICIDEIRFSRSTLRYTTSFGAIYSLPIRAYAIANLVFLLASTRPVQGGYFYIPSGRGNTIASSLTMKEWIGPGWADRTITDGTAAGGAALAQSGAWTCASTVDTSIPKYIEGRILYFYQFTLSAGEAEIYMATVNCPFQDVRDVWDETPVLLSSCLVRVNSSSSYKDFTQEAADYDKITLVELDGLATTEYVLLGSPVELMGFDIRMSSDSAKVNDNADTAMTVAYCDGGDIEDWPAVNGQDDGTSTGTGASTKSLKQSGVVSYTPVGPGQAFKVGINGGAPMYYYKLSFNAALSATVEAYYITGIPAPQKLQPCIFPFCFNNRPMRCGFKVGNEGNRVDFGMTGASDVHNGPDSSAGVESEPLYIGERDLTGAVEVYNRLGSSVYSFAIFCNEAETYILNGLGTEEFPYRHYQISASIGCLAPLTMDTWQIGVSPDGQAVRSIAMWGSLQGPVMFDSGGIQLLPGLECYFDERDSRCINFAAYANARGWFAPNGHYHFQFPSGSGQTANNVWVAYDPGKKKWYPLVPSAASPYIQAAFRVTDLAGRSYIYGSRDNGHLMRMHNGATWDGTAQVQSVTLGDILPTSDLWDETNLGRFKLLAISTAEVVSAAITHYADGNAAGTTLTAVPLNGTARYVKHTQGVDITAWSHRVSIQATISTETKGMRLLAWAAQFGTEREDR